MNDHIDRERQGIGNVMPGITMRKPPASVRPDVLPPGVKRFPIASKLRNEYLCKVISVPGFMWPRLDLEYKFLAAEELLQHGYRDHEILFGDNVMEVKMLSPGILARRRLWRRIVPYKWWTRNGQRVFPWKLLPPTPKKGKSVDTRHIWRWRFVRITPIKWEYKCG